MQNQLKGANSPMECIKLAGIFDPSMYPKVIYIKNGIYCGLWCAVAYNFVLLFTSSSVDRIRTPSAPSLIQELEIKFSASSKWA